MFQNQRPNLCQISVYYNYSVISDYYFLTIVISFFFSVLGSLYFILFLKGFINKENFGDSFSIFSVKHCI